MHDTGEAADRWYVKGVEALLMDRRSPLAGCGRMARGVMTRGLACGDTHARIAKLRTAGAGRVDMRLQIG